MAAQLRPESRRTIAQPARRIYHPVQKDWAVFLETCEESGGRRTVFDLEIAPGGGNALHVHQQFAERFELLDGELEVQLGSDVQIMQPGQAAIAAPGQPHRWANVGRHAARVRVTIQPGHEGFERGLRIFYGLAADGRCNRDGVPKSLADLAVIMTMWDTTPVGPMRMLVPFLRQIAGHARAAGVERALVERYCR